MISDRGDCRRDPADNETLFQRPVHGEVTATMTGVACSLQPCYSASANTSERSKLYFTSSYMDTNNEQRYQTEHYPMN